MLEHGEVIRTFLSQGHVCVIDDYEEEAVRLEHRDGKTSVFIKRKERIETPTIMSEDCVQNIIVELNNRIVSREES
jgi:hypothetical protein